MIIEALLYIGGYYLFMCLVTYIYGITKANEIMGFWDFSIENGYIAKIFKYPRWISWIEYVVRKVRK